MTDPFQDVDAAGPEFVKMFAAAMEARQSDPTMERIVAAYLARLDAGDGATLAEVGAGAGAVSRRIAAHAPGATVIGFEPSRGFVAEAHAKAAAFPNLSFEVADGAQLPRAPGSVDAVIMHTVLSHVPDPAVLVSEAFRVLKASGRLIVCDSDFSKASLAGFANDPLDACARGFVDGFVTDAFLISKLPAILSGCGFRLVHQAMDARLVSDARHMRPWVEVTTRQMVARGQIGQALADALMGEHDRRADGGTLYGYQPFATFHAVKPG